MTSEQPTFYPTPSVTPWPSQWNQWTPEPTVGPVPKSTQITFMIIYFVILFSCVCCAVGMSKAPLNCCRCFLANTLGCKVCEDYCCAKKKSKKGDLGEAENYLLRWFSWAKPIGEPGTESYIFQRQLFLLCWKRSTENSRNVMSTSLYYALPISSLVVFKLMYGAFSGFDTFRSSGLIEAFAAPLMFVIAVQMTAVSLVTEKTARLQESMRMMGMRELPYWGSYIIVDAIIQGLVLSIALAIVSWVLGLFWFMGQGKHGNGDGNVLDLIALLFASVLALTTLAFSIAATFDNPQTAGMFSFLLLVGDVVLFFILIFSAPDLFDTAGKQTLWCFFPPLALQIGLMSRFNCGCGLFAFIESKIPFSTVLGMLFADAVIYSVLAWYLAQVVPSEIGIQKKPWFFLLPSFWGFGTSEENSTKTDQGVLATPTADTADLRAQSGDIGLAPAPLSPLHGATEVTYPLEPVDHMLVGSPTVKVERMRKTFGDFTAVNGIEFNLYEGQIFSLLGHNGAGKTTTINMLTGLFPPDASSGNTTLYGSSIKDDISNARKNLGICPQHDVLFDNLTTREHVTFFSLLKGGSLTWESAEAEADELLEHFHMGERKNHIGSELSGGMKRKVSTAVALCGGSKFVILDEPTAGMDPLARRELWDLLKDNKKGRTMLLTTHYMDEADVLGDRIGIMSRGEIQCEGSSHFLKHQFGSGYKIILTMAHGALATTDEHRVMHNIEARALSDHPVVKGALGYVQGVIPKASFEATESSAASLVFVLPFAESASFGPLFDGLDDNLAALHIAGYGVTITSLEEVFLKVGGDHDLEEFESSSKEGQADTNQAAVDEAALRRLEGAHGEPSRLLQVYGLWWKRLCNAWHDPSRTVPLLMFPALVSIGGFVLNVTGTLGTVGDFTSTLLMALMIAAGYLPVVSIITEGVVTERVTKLRNVLTVMGCDVSSYWLGQFAGDFTLLMIPAFVTFLTAVFSATTPFPADDDVADDEALIPIIDAGKLLWLLIFSSAEVVAFCYFCSFWFPSAKTAIAFMPFFCIVMIFIPTVFVGIFWYGLGPEGADVIAYGGSAIFTNMLRGIAVCSPQGALAMGLLQIGGVCSGVSDQACVVPAYWEVLLIMILESAVFLYLAYLIDKQNLVVLEEQTYDLPAAAAAALDEDVVKEREIVFQSVAAEGGGGVADPEGGAVSKETFSLRVNGLRKLFPAKRLGDPPLQAVKSLCLGVPCGECFGLLGANGAGKTTAISMIMRSIYPNYGGITIEGKSVLNDFKHASKHLGVVTQHNTLWDKLTCRDHLRLFARLRGVPAAEVDTLVNKTVKELELGPYAHRLAGALSGGMKRKLCVAIAIVGDPDLVLLDEPSAGLDPVSRRNLWDTLIKTMEKRAVVLTTHSMEEAEALCTRIGIMVKGQLQALGTPQHLKQKHGSGYEIILQLDPSRGPVDAPDRQKPVGDFVKGLFPSAELLSDNGGLLTYKVPGESMKVGRAFEALEASKESLGIADYAVAQPTLEQVFVRTVMQHSEGERGNTLPDATSSSSSPNSLLAQRKNRSASEFESSDNGQHPLRSSMSNAPNAEALHPGMSPWVKPTLGSDGEFSPRGSIASGGGSGFQGGGGPGEEGLAETLRRSLSSALSSGSASSFSVKSPRNGSKSSAGGGGVEGTEDGGRPSMVAALMDPSLITTGVAKSWLGLDRRSHRWLGISMGLFMWICYFTMIGQRIGFLFFNFFVAWIFCMIGCAGCCCVIPNDPDESNDD